MAEEEPSSSLADLTTAIDGDSDASLADLAARVGSDSREADTEAWDLLESDTGMDAKTSALLELIEDEANILLFGPGDCPAEHSLCSRLITGNTTGGINLLATTLSNTPSERLTILQNYLDEPVRQSAVIDVKNYNRDVSYDNYDGPVDIQSISSPQELRRLGILISKQLTTWDGQAGEARLCFHSLSDLLQLNDTQQVFRFLHVLRGRVKSAGVRAHYHFDPTALAEADIQMFRSLFDTVVEYDESGIVSID